MAEARISASQLAKSTGLPATTIKRIRCNSNANPTLVSLLPISKFFGVSVSQLIGDEELPIQTNPSTTTHPKAWTKVAIIDWERVIDWPQNMAAEDLEYTSTDREIGDKPYALIVEEENWENLAPNTLLIVDPTLKPEHRDYAIVHRLGDKRATLKQVLFDDGEKYLKPVVTGYQITRLTDKHKFLGVVVEYKMELRR